ncbi:MAG: hypothetical protein LBP22_15825 [Deltaproteobacteria bacterium]|nr:hypothetical protein [Deltaproteobacteria bacterium]
MHDKYSRICGFTSAEIENCFREHLPIVLNKMKDKGLMQDALTVTDVLKLVKRYRIDAGIIILQQV